MVMRNGTIEVITGDGVLVGWLVIWAVICHRRVIDDGTSHRHSDCRGQQRERFMTLSLVPRS